MSEVWGPHSFLAYKRFRYLKLSGLGVAAATALYALDEPIGGRSGSTAVGYALGVGSATLILWLLWFGVRKRSYRYTGAPLLGWLSSHVYLGATLLLLVPLHCAFRFGWNLHTAAYVLMSVAVVSGMAGVLLYSLIPLPMTSNHPGQTLEGLLQQIADIDAEFRKLARELPDLHVQAVTESIEKTRIGGSVLRQLSGRDRHCGTSRALELVKEAHQLEGAEKEAEQRLIAILALKKTLLARVRRDVRYRALLELWLLVHIPSSLATLAAVAAHVLVVFYYR
jgi:hypothetical protein